jgi:DNA polymerase-1
VLLATKQKTLTYNVIVSDEEAFEVCEFLGAETLLAIDTETYANGLPCPKALTEKGKQFTDPFSNAVRLVQIRSRDSDAFIFDVMHLGEDGKAALVNLLDQDHITWIGHNIKFDYKMLAVNLGVRLKHVYDTMVVMQCIGFATGDGSAKSRGFRLKDGVRDYLDHVIDKTEQSSNWGAKVLSESQLQYAADDLAYLFDLYDVFTTAIRDEYNMVGGIKLEMDVLPVVGDIELNGIHFDEVMYHRVQNAARKYLPALEEKICRFIGWPMMPCPPLIRLKTGRATMPKPTSFDGESKSPLDSNQLMLKAFRDKGIHVENLQSDYLDELAKSTGHDILKEFIFYKDLTKQLTMNYVDWVHPVTKKIHPSYNQSAAATARFGCNDPNIQQVPKMDIEVPADQVDAEALKEYFDTKKGKYFLNYRYCFVAPAGQLFGSADYSGQEVRMMVALSGDKEMIRIHWEPDEIERDGKMVKNMAADVHAMTAELMWGDEGVTCWNAKTMEFPGLPGKKYRDIAKTIVFGLAYGKSAAGLAQDWGIEMEAAEAIIEKFFKPYKTLKQWLDRQGRIGNDTRMCLFGIPAIGITRWRMLNSGRHTDAGALKRAGMNTPIQGGSALMMKMALVLLHPLVIAAGGELCGTVHDEVLFRFPPECKAAVLAAVDEGMEKACAMFLQGIVPAKHGVGISTHWSKD